MGREAEALAFARNNIDAWTREIEGAGLDAILITVSGCGTMIKDYGFMLRTDKAYADKAARVSALAKDVSEYLARLALAPLARHAWPHTRLSLGMLASARTKSHARAERIAFQGRLYGQRCAGGAPVLRLGGHLQHHAAGIGEALAARKVANIETLAPDVIAAGNIGCITQIAAGTAFQSCTRSS